MSAEEYAIVCTYGKSESFQVHCYQSMTLSDLRDMLFSLTDILPDSLYITLPSGACIGPEAPSTPLATAGIVPGTSIHASSTPPPAQQSPGPSQAVSLDAVSAALAACSTISKEPPSTASRGGSPAQLEAGVQYLRQLRSYYDAVLEYEQPKLQEKALKVLPLDQLRTEAAGLKMACPDAALAKAILRWFKEDFFEWVNALPCWSCGGDGEVIGGVEPSIEERRHRASVVEVHRCKKCGATVRFPRYNDPAKLLETRKGRCGEWAQAFTLIVRAAGLTARCVHDATDHVWTEIWSPGEGRWLHADSCENILDEPLLYEKGWGKKLSYAVAVGVGSASDVMRRYTEKFDDILTRRTAYDETWLASEIEKLNQEAVAAVPVAERTAATKRNEADRAEMLGSGGADPNAEELPGRQSGSTEWVQSRGEDGK